MIFNKIKSIRSKCVLCLIIVRDPRYNPVLTDFFKEFLTICLGNFFSPYRECGLGCCAMLLGNTNGIFHTVKRESVSVHMNLCQEKSEEIKSTRRKEDLPMKLSEKLLWTRDFQITSSITWILGTWSKFIRWCHKKGKCF